MAKVSVSDWEKAARWKERRAAIPKVFRRIWRGVGWLGVVGAALTIGAWSLYWVARHIGAPPPVALLFSVCFDGGALYMADSSLRAAQNGESGSVSRFWLFVLVAISAGVQTLHAQLTHGGWRLMVVYASFPVIAIVTYDDHIRRERHKALVRNGRLVEDRTRKYPLSYRWLYLIRTYFDNRGEALAHMRELRESPRTIAGTVVRPTGRTERPIAPTEPTPARTEPVSAEESRASAERASEHLARLREQRAAGRSTATGAPDPTTEAADPIGATEPTAGTEPTEPESEAGPVVIPFSQRHAPHKHVREWARAQGYRVSDRGGALPRDILDAYDAAHAEEKDA